jgi:[ribosomal protein S18]-alanine N-acetyltransferase
MMLSHDIEIQMLSAIDTATFLEKNEIADFLSQELGEFGDTKNQILKCLDYALSNYPHQGGYVVLARKNGEIIGATVTCHTGMEGYIPENALVYIAIKKDLRRNGLGKELMKKTILFAKGDIALHVRPENPALKMFENLGFKNQYIEMRLKK